MESEQSLECGRARSGLHAGIAADLASGRRAGGGADMHVGWRSRAGGRAVRVDTCQCASLGLLVILLAPFIPESHTAPGNQALSRLGYSLAGSVGGAHQ